MKKMLFLLALLFLLSCGCSSPAPAELPAGGVSPFGSRREAESEEGSRPTEEEPAEESEAGVPDANALLEALRIDDSMVRIDPNLRVRSNEVAHGPSYFEWSPGQARIANSYEIVGSVSYLDQWYLDYEVYLPRFLDEIPFEGAAVIQAYYEAQAEDARIAMEEYLSRDLEQGFLFDSPTFYKQYHFSDYRVFSLNQYLSVIHDVDVFSGGAAHNSYGSHVDFFDMRTGQRLELLSVLKSDDGAKTLLEQLVEHYSDPEDLFVSYKVYFDGRTHFYFEEQGVVFIFNPGVNGPFLAGRRMVTIPWEDMAPLLLIELA